MGKSFGRLPICTATASGFVLPVRAKGESLRCTSVHIQKWTCNINHYFLFKPEDHDPREVEADARALRPRGGIIIVLKKEDKTYYYSTDRIPLRFGDPTRMEEPVTYRRLSAAIKKMEALREEYSNFGCCLAMWIHPDVGSGPLEKYLRLRKRFPGCPRH
jgi:hypothetical protein